MGEDFLLLVTIRRVEGIHGAELAPPMVVCNEEFRFVIAEPMRLLGQPGSEILEPLAQVVPNASHVLWKSRIWKRRKFICARVPVLGTAACS